MDGSGERVTANGRYQRCAAAEVGEGNGRIGGGAAYVDILAESGHFRVLPWELVHAVDNVDGGEADEDGAGQGCSFRDESLTASYFS